MKSLKLLVIPFVLAILFAGCSWDGNSTSVIEKKDVLSDVVIGFNETRGSITTTVTWKAVVTNGITYAIQRTITNVDGTEASTRIVEDFPGTSYIDSFNSNEENVLVTYYIYAYVGTEILGQSVASFYVLPNDGTLRMTMQSVEAYNTCDLYDISGIDATGDLSLCYDGDVLIADTKANDTWSVENYTLEANKYFHQAIYVHVDDYAAEKYGLTAPGHFQISNSDNCKIEVVDSPSSDVMRAWTLSFEDIPLSNVNCDEDFNDVVVLVELLK